MDAKPWFRPAHPRRFVGAVLLVWTGGGIALSAGDPAGVFISEYVEGSSSNRALEIFNGSATTVDLATGGYFVQLFFNGSPSPGATIALTGVVPSGGTWVLVDDAAGAELLALADEISTALSFTGDDAVVLRANGVAGVVIDSIGQVGFDPGSAWTGGGLSTQDRTLRRKDGICLGDLDTQDPFDPSVGWLGFPLDEFAGLGEHTSTCSAYVFNDGFETGDTSRWTVTLPGFGAAA